MAGAVARSLLRATVLAVALAACGGGDGAAEQRARAAAPWLDPDGEYPVVGALAVNPAGGELWMATNAGLFRVPRDGVAPIKISGRLRTPGGEGAISEQLVISFTGP